MLDWAIEAAEGLFAFLTSYGFVYSPLYLITSLAIAMLYWFVSKPGKGVFEYIFPREIYGHASHKADLSIASFNVLFIGLGGLSFLTITPLIAGGIVTLAAEPASLVQSNNMPLGLGIILVILLVLTEDLSRYLVHRAHHMIAVLWPFHAVHHSAEVLTPITFFRAHPVYYVPQQLLISLFAGALQGLVVVLAFGTAPGWVFFAAVMVSRCYMMLGMHLRHSHIPLGYGPVLERLLISPRLHQVHHSVEKRHYDQNFGEIFAIWDWMFGTLYIPEKGEQFTFGLTNATGERFQPYPTLRDAMINPFAEGAAALRSSLPEKPDEETGQA